jgi:hypothetical protein
MKKFMTNHDKKELESLLNRAEKVLSVMAILAAIVVVTIVITGY